MSHTNEALSYAIYMANSWNESECSYVFNGYGINNENYEYSIGHHIWEKYVQYYENRGVYGAPMKLLYELDSKNLKLILDRACELYNGRENRK